MGGFRLEIDLVGEELHAKKAARAMDREASKCVVFGLQPGR